jgi:hypothetical protein
MKTKHTLFAQLIHLVAANHPRGRDLEVARPLAVRHLALAVGRLVQLERVGKEAVLEDGALDGAAHVELVRHAVRVHRPVRRDVAAIVGVDGQLPRAGGGGEEGGGDGGGELHFEGWSCDQVV